MDDGATLSQYGCHDGVNQQWILADADPGTLRIVARNSGKVLDVRGEHTEDGTPVNQYGWKSSANQKFKLALAVDDVAPAQTAKDGAGGTGGKAGKADKAGKAGKVADTKATDVKAPAAKAADAKSGPPAASRRPPRPLDLVQRCGGVEPTLCAFSRCG